MTESVSDWEHAIRFATELDLNPEPDSESVRPETRDQAVKFLEFFRGLRYPAPTHIYPAADGSVLVEWVSPRGRLIADVRGLGVSMRLVGQNLWGLTCEFS